MIKKRRFRYKPHRISPGFRAFSKCAAFVAAVIAAIISAAFFAPKMTASENAAAAIIRSQTPDTLLIPYIEPDMPRESAAPSSVFTYIESAPPPASDIPDPDTPPVPAAPYIPPEGVGEMTIVPAGVSYDGVYLKNSSGKAVDLAETLAAPLTFPASREDPLVLIVHTHGTEAFVPTPEERSSDISENIVRVGTELKNALGESGISCIHDETMYDLTSYTGSYARMMAGAEAILEKYPSIQVIIDIHRDAIIADDGTKYSVVTEIDGRRAAQLMFVMGTDAKVLHPNWRQNLSLAAKIQCAAAKKHPQLFRPIMLTDGRYSQHISVGSLLIEFGASGNTLDEALFSAQLLAPAIADVLTGA